MVDASLNRTFQSVASLSSACQVTLAKHQSFLSSLLLSFVRVHLSFFIVCEKGGSG